MSTHSDVNAMQRGSNHRPPSANTIHYGNCGHPGSTQHTAKNASFATNLIILLEYAAVNRLLPNRRAYLLALGAIPQPVERCMKLNRMRWLLSYLQRNHRISLLNPSQYLLNTSITCQISYHHLPNSIVVFYISLSPLSPHYSNLNNVGFI